MQTENLQAITNKLDIESAALQYPTVPIEPIKDYLRSACFNNAYLAEMMLTENRTLSGCVAYVEKQVRQQLHNRSGYIPDAEVFGMAEDFYYLSYTEINDLLNPPIQSACKVASKSNHPPAPTKPLPESNLQLNLFDSPTIEIQPETSDSEATVAPNNNVEDIDNEQKTA